MVTKTTRLSLLALLALTCVSCSENLLDGGRTASSSKGRSATVQLKVSTAPEQEANGTTRTIDPNETDEGTAPDYKVSDLWLLEYGTDGRLMKDDKGGYVAKYITMEQLAANGGKLGVQLPRVGSADKYKCVLIANTHDDRLFGSGNLSDYWTLDDIKKNSKDIKTFKDTYNTTAVGGKKAELYLSCVAADVEASTTFLDCEFYRNVAKLTLKLKNLDKSGMRITGVQLCNVPNKLSYADRLYEGGTNDKFTSGASLMDFPKEDIVLNANESRELVYYLPRNCQGSDANITDARKKNTSSKASTSTCVKVFATDTNTDVPYRYTFYVGEKVSDFNVEPNYHYALPVEISGHGDENIDSRVEDLASMGANCIMMSLNDKDKDSIYTIYPYKRINKFWNKMGSDVDKQERVIDENYDWEAVIVWQDTNDDVIEFVDSGKETFLGRGKRPLKIRLKNPTAPCNVLIGVKRPGVVPKVDGYLWSWHLWVTPYKPNLKEPWEDGKYEYTVGVTKGSVFRYDPGTVNESGNDLWKPDGEYYNKYIMDRNLGATTKGIPLPSDDLKKSAGLRYQFGRKDPFVANGVTLYKSEHGPSISVADAYAGKESIGYVVAAKWPDQFFTAGGNHTYWDWVDPNDYYNQLWNNIFPSEKEFKGKSFFDPCPEGWRIPLKGTWNIFAGGGKVGVKYYNPNIKGTFNNGYYFYVGNGVTTFYPVGGTYDSYCRNTAERNDGPGVYGSLWSANPYNRNNSYFLSYRSGYVAPMGPVNEIRRAEARSIRCIQE